MVLKFIVFFYFLFFLLFSSFVGRYIRSLVRFREGVGEWVASDGLVALNNTIEMTKYSEMMRGMRKFCCGTLNPAL